MKLSQTLRPIRIASLLASLTFLSTSAFSGSVFLSEGFGYADGQLTDSLSGGAAGANVSGGNWKAHSGETFDDNVGVIGGKAQLLNSGSEDVNRMIGTTMAAGQTFYFAAQMAVNFTGASGDALNNDYFLHLKDGGFGFRARVYLDAPSGGGDYALGLSSTSGGQVAKTATDLSFGTTQTIVGSYAFDTGETKLWVNPTDESSAFLTDTGGEGVAIDSIALRQDFISGPTANNEILIDSLAVGDDFAGVFASVTATVVPEPSSALLFLCGGSLLAFKRRRR
ncbi:MAG: hypothetical protein ACI9R3_000324 [Verrucomicrobiales bacterium]|jgi:hypothetical protein